MLFNCESSTNSLKDDPSATGKVIFTAKSVTNLHKQIAKTVEQSVNITPVEYKLALVNYWLIADDDSLVNIINPDSANPNYDYSNPLIIDFSEDSLSQFLFQNSSFVTGTYVGYKMEFLYMEMQLPVQFHIPYFTWETDYTDSTVFDNLMYKNFRLYFNTHGKFWKRDFVVELESGTDEWYWMRRELESPDAQNFFISVDANSHPVGGAGPNQTIDLFSDEDFWGLEADYDNPDTRIIIGTHSTVGGLDCRMENSFTIPDDFDETIYIDLQIDYTTTMNFWEEDSLPAFTPFSYNILDLGPGFNASGAYRLYGDYGLHPFLPIFEIILSE